MSRNLSIGPDPNFFVPCLNDSTKLQVKALNNEALKGQIEAKSLSAEDGAKLHTLFDERKMTHAEIKAKIIEIRGFMTQVFEAWTGPMQSFTLTSVGMAIGHANIKRFTGDFSKLEIWIN